MTLRYLTEGQVWDIRSNFGLGTCELYRLFWRVVDAPNEGFPIDLDLTNKRQLEELEQWVAEKSRLHALRGGVGAVDD